MSGPPQSRNLPQQPHDANVPTRISPQQFFLDLDRIISSDTNEQGIMQALDRLETRVPNDLTTPDVRNERSSAIRLWRRGLGSHHPQVALRCATALVDLSQADDVVVRVLSGPRVFNTIPMYHGIHSDGSAIDGLYFIVIGNYDFSTREHALMALARSLGGQSTIVGQRAISAIVGIEGQLVSNSPSADNLRLISLLPELVRSGLHHPNHEVQFQSARLLYERGNDSSNDVVTILEGSIGSGSDRFDLRDFVGLAARRAEEATGSEQEGARRILRAALGSRDGEIITTALDYFVGQREIDENVLMGIRYLADYHVGYTRGEVFGYLRTMIFDIGGQSRSMALAECERFLNHHDPTIQFSSASLILEYARSNPDAHVNVFGALNALGRLIPNADRRYALDEIDPFPLIRDLILDNRFDLPTREHGLQILGRVLMSSDSRIVRSLIINQIGAIIHNPILHSSGADGEQVVSLAMDLCRRSLGSTDVYVAGTSALALYYAGQRDESVLTVLRRSLDVRSNALNYDVACALINHGELSEPIAGVILDYTREGQYINESITIPDIANAIINGNVVDHEIGMGLLSEMLERGAAPVSIEAIRQLNRIASTVPALRDEVLLIYENSLIIDSRLQIRRAIIAYGLSGMNEPRSRLIQILEEVGQRELDEFRRTRRSTNRSAPHGSNVRLTAPDDVLIPPIIVEINSQLDRLRDQE